MLKKCMSSTFQDAAGRWQLDWPLATNYSGSIDVDMNLYAAYEA